MKYPIDRAEILSRKIKELAVLRSGGSLLESFCKLLTEIGNALGLVIVVRAAHMKYCEDIQQFITTQSLENYCELSKNSGQRAEAQAAAALVDELAEKDSNTFTFSGLQIFANVFNENILESEECKHLELFYLLVPSLMIVFISNIMQIKNTLNTKSMVKGYFRDDGFALGVAYFLKVVRQTEKFAGLNWFESVIQKYTKDMNIQSSDLTSEQNMMIKRAEECKKEFKELMYSFVAARQYFRDE